MSRRSQKREQERKANKKITFMEIGKLANELREGDGVSYEEIMNHPEKVDYYNEEARSQLKIMRKLALKETQYQRVSNAEKSALAHEFKSNGGSKILQPPNAKAGPPVGKNTSTYMTGRQLYGSAYGEPVRGTSKAERRRKKR